MNKTNYNLLFLSFFALFLCNYTNAQTEDQSPGLKLLRMAEAKKIVTADIKIDSPIFNSMHSERVSLWDKRASLLAKRNGLSPVEYVTNSEINIEIELLTAKINDLDERLKNNFASVKNAGVNQPYVDKCLAKILKQASDALQPFVNGNFSGKTVLGFYIIPTGEIRKLKVSNSTGQSLLDDTLVDAVVASSPCDIFSKEMQDRLDFLFLTVPFEFGRKRTPQQN